MKQNNTNYLERIADALEGIESTLDYFSGNFESANTGDMYGDKVVDSLGLIAHIMYEANKDVMDAAKNRGKKKPETETAK